MASTERQAQSMKGSMVRVAGRRQGQREKEECRALEIKKDLAQRKRARDHPWFADCVGLLRKAEWSGCWLDLRPLTFSYGIGLDLN